MITPWRDSGPVERLNSGALEHFSLSRADDGKLLGTVMKSEFGEWYGFALEQHESGQWRPWQAGPFKTGRKARRAVEKKITGK